jgi:hypothetical protein
MPTETKKEPRKFGPIGFDYKEYGPHKYTRAGTSDCEYGCGCWAGDARSGGPLGLEPISGRCPANPVNGEPLGGKKDYEYVVMDRIESAERRAYEAEDLLRKVKPDKIKLVSDRDEALRERGRLEVQLHRIREILRQPSN